MSKTRFLFIIFSSTLSALIFKCSAIENSTSGIRERLDQSIPIVENSSFPQGFPLTEGILTSISVNLFKRSDSEPVEPTKVPKRKPKLYSWWMPNMTMSNADQSSIITTLAPSEMNNIPTTQSSSDVTSKPTRKPRPTRPPRTRRPTSTSSSEERTTLESISTTTESSSTSLLSSTTNNPLISSSTAPGYGVKRKFIKVVKTVGKVAVKTIGAVSSIALGVSSTVPIIQVAGKVGSVAKGAAGQVGSIAAPIAHDVARQVGSFALSAANNAGSYAADATGKALVRFAASLSNITSTTTTSTNAKPTLKIKVSQNVDPREKLDKNEMDEGKIVNVYVQNTDIMKNPATMGNKNDKEDRMLMDVPMEMDEPIKQSKPKPTPRFRKKQMEVEENGMERNEQSSGDIIHKSKTLFVLIALGIQIALNLD